MNAEIMSNKRFVLNGRNEYDGGSTHYCFDFPVHFNRRGNIVVVVDDLPLYFVPFPGSKRYVFNRKGVCISHTPSDRYRHHKVNAELVESHT